MTTVHHPQWLKNGLRDLAWGTHVSYFYERPADLIETVVPFLQAGVERRELCVWYLDPSISADAATSALRIAIRDIERRIAAGDVRLVTNNDLKAQQGASDVDALLKMWVQAGQVAADCGYAGVRAAGGPEGTDARSFSDVVSFERRMNRAVHALRMVRLCHFALRNHDAGQLFDLASLHGFALTRRNGVWEILETPTTRNEEMDRWRRELFDRTHDLMVMTTPDGDIIDANRRFEAVSGLTIDELRGVAVADQVAPEDRPALQQMLHDAAGGQSPEHELRWQTKAGEVVYLDAASGAVFNLAGEPLYIHWTMRDVTERKRTALALRERIARTREDERARVARELHDQLGSTLTSVKWDLEEIERSTATGTPSTWHPQLEDAIACVEETIATVRNIAAELRPPMLEDLGLIAAIEWQAARFERQTGIETRVDAPIDEADEPGPATGIVLFRILQEALTNVRRHANATRVNILLERDGSSLGLEIADNGVGIPVEAIAARSSLGLTGMRERAEQVGGQLEIAGTPGKTIVTVRIPSPAGARSQPRHES